MRLDAFGHFRKISEILLEKYVFRNFSEVLRPGIASASAICTASLPHGYSGGGEVGGCVEGVWRVCGGCVGHFLINIKW